MPEILTVTVNPAIDVATSTDHVVPGPKLKCGPTRVDPGGGGINVARVIARFGGDAKAVVAVGGATGEQLISMVRADGVSPIPVWVSGQTRQNLAVIDTQSGEQYRFSLPGDQWNAKDYTKFIRAIKANAEQDSFVVLSGGIAPGMPVAFLGRVQSELTALTNNIIIDTCDPSLSHLIAEQHTPFHVLRLDQNEAAAAARRDLGSLQDCFEFASDLIARGVARIVVIGRGSEGSLMATQDRRLFCHAAKVTVASKIGAGDAFVGGFTLRLSRGEPLESALQWGVAAASATVCTEGTALCSLQDAEALLPQCRVETVGA